MWNKIKIYEIKQNKITQDKSKDGNTDRHKDRNKDKNKSRQRVWKIEKTKYMAIENYVKLLWKILWFTCMDFSSIWTI